MPNISNFIILAIIVVAMAVVVRNYIRKGGHGDCCGDTDGNIKLKGPKDRDVSHYTHAYNVTVTGMSCDNCATKVANAFNGQDGMYAEVSLTDGKALVRTKEVVDADALKAVVRNAGYGVGEITEA